MEHHLWAVALRAYSGIERNRLGRPGARNPTAGDQFTVQVQDSEASPVAASQTLNISVLAGSGSNNGLITGSYSFLFNGYDSGGPVAIAGSVTTDGNGNITGGTEDTNRISRGTVQVVLTAALTGSYKLNSDGTGSMQLIATNPKSGVTLTTDYVIVLDSSGTIHFIENNDITTPNIGTDTLGTHGEGILKPVLGTFSSGSLNGNYSFLFSGQDLNGKQAAFAGAINANGISTIVPAAGGVSTDFNDAGTTTSQNISGTFSGGSNNRGSAVFLIEIPGKSQDLLQFAFYFVNSSDFYFIEVDSTSTSGAQPCEGLRTARGRRVDFNEIKIGAVYEVEGELKKVLRLPRNLNQEYSRPCLFRPA